MTDKLFVLDHVKSLTGASYDRPFEDDFDTTVMRHNKNGKWFGIIMNVSGKKIGSVNYKAQPYDSPKPLYEL